RLLERERLRFAEPDRAQVGERGPGDRAGLRECKTILAIDLEGFSEPLHEPPDDRGAGLDAHLLECNGVRDRLDQRRIARGTQAVDLAEELARALELARHARERPRIA